ITAITASLYWMLDLNNWIWILPALSVYWGWLRYRDAATALSENILVIRSRVLAKNTAFIQRKRVQDITISQSWIQRFRKLCTLTVHVASGDQGRSFTVRDLEITEGRYLLKELKQFGTDYSEFQNVQKPEFRVNLPGWTTRSMMSQGHQAAAN
ncbi:MAG: PH domain-containing protein, partial [Balneolaceae bacterium]|nr:PH domain-containing protein [Balneolaceae bacterium]